MTAPGDATVDVEAVVGRLTKAQREALLDELLAIRTGVYRVARQLRGKSLLTASCDLTLLGLAVRDRLLAQGRG